MAPPPFSTTLITLLTFFILSHQQLLDPTEQEAVYKVLHSIDPSIPWPTLFPPDENFCLSPPHGLICDYPSNDTVSQALHVVELSFGYVSDESPNPPCSQNNATINPILFTSFPYLQKLFFYRCFNSSHGKITIFPHFPPSFSSTLQELVFIDNPSILAPFSTMIRNFTSLRRLVLVNNGFNGEVTSDIGSLVNLEELSLSGNNLSGEIPRSLGNLKKLKVLDLSHNRFEGCLPESLGENFIGLVKLDLSYNGFSCKVPESLGNLQRLELLDLSFNKFGNFGVPLFLGNVPTLKEVYLSGNNLGGVIPEIWENLGGLRGIGFSELGLVGEIPASMGVYLKNLSYLGLDNNMLEGPVPEEFGLLENANEINLENNNLSGKVPSSIKVGEKLKLKGNTGLCVDDRLRCSGSNSCSLLGQQQLSLCNKADFFYAELFSRASLMAFDPFMLLMSLWVLFVFLGL